MVAISQASWLRPNFQYSWYAELGSSFEKTQNPETTCLDENWKSHAVSRIIASRASFTTCNPHKTRLAFLNPFILIHPLIIIQLHQSSTLNLRDFETLASSMAKPSQRFCLPRLPRTQKQYELPSTFKNFRQPATLRLQPHHPVPSATALLQPAKKNQKKKTQNFTLLFSTPSPNTLTNPITHATVTCPTSQMTTKPRHR